MAEIMMAKNRRVEILDADLLRRRDENKSYLLELDTELLMLPYLMEAGRCQYSDTPKKIHGGWESPLCELRGHFLGHWLSAAAMHYAATGNQLVKAKADEIVEELRRCQIDNGGKWAASIPEKYLFWIAEKKAIWAPQYTIHKTFMGLLDMYEMAGNEQALEIAVRFGEWFYEWSGQYSETQFQDILDVETGGMLEIWAILFRITRNEKFHELMERYYRHSLFDGLLASKDVLTNMHANTTIPEILGAAAAYEVTGEERWMNIVRNYWDWAVVKRGSYATGGQTCGEIWSPLWKLDARLGDKNQEHCTVYNMMRLADFLFCHTGDVQYADYWEKNLYNGIMAQGYWEGSFTHGRKSDYPTKGLLTYFLPMRAGSQKAWSSHTQDFFCCHGSLVQANAAHNTGIYYEGTNEIYICQYIESDYCGNIGDNSRVTISLRNDRMNGTLHMASDSPGTQKINEIAARYPNAPQKKVYDLKISVEQESEFTLQLRIPSWVKGKAAITVMEEGSVQSFDGTPGSFLAIHQQWKKQTIHLEFPKQIQVDYLPGRTDMAAFLDGPVLLVGLCEEERMLHTGTRTAEELLVPDNEREWGNWMGTWKTIGQEHGIRFVPLNQVGYEHYTVYFPIEE